METLKRKKFKHIYGPVSSWRLGRSLGIDLLSEKGKACTFNCLYCQIGHYAKTTKKRREFVSTEDVLSEIARLPKGIKIDFITCSGCGEPTLAKNLGQVINDTRRLKKKKIAVITNSSLLSDKSVIKELKFADNVVAKIDAFSEKSFRKINRPARGIKFKDVYGAIKRFRKGYNGKLSIQIMLIKENRDHLRELADLALSVMPHEIQINTPTRPSHSRALSKLEVRKAADFFRDFAKSRKQKVRIISVYEAKRKATSPLSRKETIKRRGTAN